MKGIFFTVFIVCTSIIVSFGQTGETELYDQFKKSDKELKAIVARFEKKLDTADKAVFIKAQNAWVQYREFHCKFSSKENEGGVITHKMKLNCMTVMTESRIVELKELIEDF